MTPLQKSLYRLSLTTAAAAFMVFGIAACKSSQDQQQAQIAQQDDSGAVDPATANLAPGQAAPTGGSTQVLGQNESYAPRQSSADYDYNDYDADTADQTDQAPPPIPEYDQPEPPGPDWYWTPGYWAWGPDGYYWVPGTWVEPPYYGALWTPPYWGWYGGHYLFHRGYWGPHVGFYGGIDYGFGYVGIGYYGGYWRGHDFYYNRAVTNVGRVGNYYNRPVVVNNVHYGARPQNRVSYNGGRGGVDARPRPQELAARGERHAPPVAEQTQLHETAAHNPAFAYNTNHGRPEHAAFARPEAAGVPVNRANEPNRAAEPNRPNEANRPGEPMNRPNQPGFNNRPGNPAEAPRNAQIEQRNNELQQRNNQLQQHNNEAAQRNVQTQQRNLEMQQRNTQLQQRNNEAAQRNAAVQQQRNAQMQQHNMQMQQRNMQMQQRAAEPRPAAPREVPQPRPVQPQRSFQPAPRPQPAPHMEAPRPAPAPRMEAPRPAPVPHMEAPRAAPAAAPHPAGGGGEHEHR